MKHDDLSNHAVIWGWVALTLLVIGVAKYPPTNSGEVAAWVQGVGTIAAIGVTGWVGTLPMRSQQSERTEGRRVFAESLATTTKLTRTLTNRLKVAIEAKDSRAALSAIGAIQELGCADLFSTHLREPRWLWPSEGSYVYAHSTQRMLGLLATQWSRFGELRADQDLIAAWWGLTDAQHSLIADALTALEVGDERVPEIDVA